MNTWDGAGCIPGNRAVIVVLKFMTLRQSNFKFYEMEGADFSISVRLVPAAPRCGERIAFARHITYQTDNNIRCLRQIILLSTEEAGRCVGRPPG